MKDKKDKTKPVVIEIPVGFKWIARQRNGDYLLSTKKPYLQTNGDFLDEESETPKDLIQWWAVKDANYDNSFEIEFDKWADVKDWRNSLTRI